MINHKQERKLLKYFLYYHKPYKWQLMSLVFFSIILGLNGFVNSYLTKIIIDNLIDLKNENAILKAIFWPAGFIFLYMELYNISWRALDYVRLNMIPVIRNNIIIRAFEYIHEHSLSFFQNNLSGSIANNINILADNIDLISKTIFIYITRGIVQIVVAFIAMYGVDPIFALVLSIWVISFITVSMKFSKKIAALSKITAESYAVLSGQIHDSITNAIDVKIFARQNFETMNLSKFLNIHKNRYKDKEWFLLKFHYLQGASITVFIGCIVYNLIQFRISEQLTIGEFTFILGIALYITEYVWTLTEYIDQVNEAIGKCSQAIKAIFIDIEINDHQDAKPLVITAGEITFNKVCFQYNATVTFFHNKSITIQPKQKIGLVGYSGGGKTTFVNLLLRLYEIDSGQILIDNQNIQTVTQSSLHKAIAVISQNSFLFHRTLMDNIRYGNLEATDAEVIEAAQQANIHDFINDLPEQYNSLVGEKGFKLSGGQRQRLVFARVILKNAPILILDEATSQLDSITENTIKTTLEKIIQNKTTIIIAHRLSTLLKMDRILVFDNGNIIEDGTHTELLKANKLYSKLWKAQKWG